MFYAYVMKISTKELLSKQFDKNGKTYRIDALVKIAVVKLLVLQREKQAEALYVEWYQFNFKGRNSKSILKRLESVKGMLREGVDYAENPIIVNRGNVIFDGMHRVAVSYVRGQKFVQANVKKIGYRCRSKKDFAYLERAAEELPQLKKRLTMIRRIHDEIRS
jgi:hypothetical protein